MEEAAKGQLIKKMAIEAAHCSETYWQCINASQQKGERVQFNTRILHQEDKAEDGKIFSAATLALFGDGKQKKGMMK